MATRATNERVRNELVEVLKYSGLSKENMKELTRIAAIIQETGIRPIKVFPIGIPVPDGIQIRALLDKETLQSLNKILLDVPRVNGVEVFPRGIPKPDIFD